MILFILMCIAGITTFPKLRRLRKLDRASFESVPSEKFEEWFQLEMKSLMIMALVCKVYLFFAGPLLIYELISISNDSYAGIMIVGILHIAFYIFLVISAIRQYKPAKQARKLKNEYAISY
jgi:uncharacterized membrane protein